MSKKSKKDKKKSKKSSKKQIRKQSRAALPKPQKWDSHPESNDLILPDPTDTEYKSEVKTLSPELFSTFQGQSKLSLAEQKQMASMKIELLFQNENPESPKVH